MKRKCKILIVDDSKTALLYTTNIVSGIGCGFVTAVNGREALKLLRNESFDMIISDILMPEMDGFQLLTHIKKDDKLKKIPFIFHTATYTGDEDKELGYKLGVDAYILKQNNPLELFSIIEKIFEDIDTSKFISNNPVIEQEKEVFKLYNKRLINKLEHKVFVLEQEKIKRKKLDQKLIKRGEYLSALSEAKDILLQIEPNNTFQRFVDVLGEVANASRTYIFINSTNEKGEILMNHKAEYCAEGVIPEIGNPLLQNLRYSDYCPRWEKVLSKGKIIFGNVKDFPKSEKEVLESQNIKSILVIPIMVKNHFFGFIGFDNCTSNNEWKNVERYFLKVAAKDLAQFLERKKTEEKLKAENRRFQITMDTLDAVVYVSDMQTYELIYQNELRKNITGGRVGKKCYDTLQTEQSGKPCNFCNNDLLLDDKGNPKPPHVWEFKNTVSNRWYQCRDRAITWPDGRTVRLEIATDITRRKENEILLQKSKDSLQELNNNLHEVVNAEIELSREKDRIMLFQSKQASMGEMIGSIAHQWRQPLNEIGINIQNLHDKYEYDKLSPEVFDDAIERIMVRLEYLSQTIDDFRNFFHSDKEKIEFSVTENIKKTLALTEASFTNNMIKTVFHFEDGIIINSYPNELSQAVLNILNNAKDILIEREIKNPVLKISLLKKDNKVLLSIADNGGGIDVGVIDKIFDPYFTKRENHSGTGLGLYISKTIIEKNMGGKLSVINAKYGAEFLIEL